MRRLSTIVFILGFAAACANAQTSTLYKHVDKDGKVTYTDKPPAKDEAERKDGAATKKLGMDNERNVIKSTPKSSDAPNTRAADNRKKNEAAAAEKTYEEAKKAYEAARAAYESGKEPRDDEWRTVGVSKGAPARVPNEAYEERIKRLEAAVAAAEKQLREAERALR